MSNSELKKTLIAVSRAPVAFRRDTPLLLKTLENLEAINRRMKTVNQQIAFDEGADICDTLKDEEK